MRTAKVYRIIMAVFLLVIVINFGIHYTRTKAFNERPHTAPADGSGDSYVFDFYPQNGNAVSWEKETRIAGEPVKLYACNYEASLTNNDEVSLSEWKMRVDIVTPCYIQSAWCGKVEIHQNVQAAEKVQTLDLRAPGGETITLDSYTCDEIVLYPLQPGDYVIYHPNTAVKEAPITMAGDEPASVVIGMIFYWEQDAAYEPPTATVDYYLNKGYFQGPETVIAAVSLSLWLLMLAVGITVRVTGKRLDARAARELEKSEIEKQATERMLDQTIRALAYALDAKDEYTHGHSERVAEYSLKLAQALQLPNDECKRVFYAGLVHDVGKIGIPNAIINKPGRLTDEEFAVIKTHPARGERILSKITEMPYLAVGAKYHHEKYDGTGYPDHVRGEDTPLLARIIAVADAYDAMTSQRSYRKTLDQYIVKQEIWKGMGSQFDPQIAKHMIALIDADLDYDMREKKDESYEMIDRIARKDFWEESDPRSIKSEDKLMAETDVRYFGQFLYQLEDWRDPEKLTEVSSAEEKTITLHSRTKEDAEYIWDTPVFLLYSSENGETDGDDYKEYAVVYSSGYSWKTGLALHEDVQLTRKEAFGDWKHWNEANANGMDYTLRVRKEQNVITLAMENELLSVTQRVELPKDNTDALYVSVTAKHCELQLPTQ